ncbi:enoyl-CoA hydratase-related protein [Oceanobacillus rekensis]|uniref:enoyl-CoA hydratase-related protein n=1 Tax=Oceanobacillus rekensis TaxID=937927 RepID=UPI000B43F95F|nr:enoyl-CoA hydratase-related protein [Oceanobacillus rekensis]
MDYQFINLLTHDQIAIIELNAPPANTLSAAMISELRVALKHIQEETNIHAVILTGSGKFFAAGADIREFVPAMGDYDKGFAMSQAGQALCNEIEALTKPVIAAINGPALGGGLEIALGSHFRVMSEDAIIGLPELKLGLLPSFGGTQRLTKITGTATALNLILTGKQIKSKEAIELGIAQLAVPSDDLRTTALSIATSFVEGNSMESVQRVIECIVQGANESLTSGLQRESEKFAELFLTEDAKEGVSAFVEKRQAQFNHR